MSASENKILNDAAPLQQEVIAAVRKGDNAEIERFISNDADIKAKDGEGNTLLHWAAAEGHLETLKMLVDRGLDIRATANNGSTLLHSAAANGRNDIIQYLLTNGIDFNVKTNDGYTPLHLAAWNGQVDAIKLLMRCGAEFGAKDSSGRTALDLASEQNHDAVRDYLTSALQRIADLKAAVLRFDNSEIDRLVVEGAYIHAKDDTGSTLLHWAASLREKAAGQVETMRQLATKYNVDRQARDNRGNTVLHTAAVNCRKAAMAYLVVECGMDINSVGADGYTLLHLAAWMGHIDSVTFLVQNGANVYAKAQDGRAAQELAFDHNIVRDYLASTAQQKLLNAVYKGDIAEIKSLIAQGAEIPIMLIHCAAQHNQVAMIEYFLLEREMNVDCRNPQGETPLHVAACYGCQEAINCLLSHNADLNSVDSNDFTPLHWAVLQKHSTVIPSLVAAGVNVNAKSKTGEAVLHIAACHGVKEAVEHLLKAKERDINLGDHQYGYTALHWAARNGHKEIVDILLAHGADPSITDSQGRTYKELSSSQQQEVQSSLASSESPLHTVGYFAASKPQEQSTAVSGHETLAPPSMSKKIE